MDFDNPMIYGLEFQTRALTSQVAETDVTRFIVGTQCITQANNQIHLLELNEKSESLKTRIYHHRFGEIWKITSSPFDADIISTCFNTISDSKTDQSCRMKTAYFKLEMQDNDVENLEQLVEFETDGGDIKTNEFHPEDRNKCGVMTDTQIIFYDVGNGESSESSRVTLEGKNNPKFTGGKWYPHQNAHQFLAIQDANLLSYDTRTNNLILKIETNPSSQYSLKDLDVNSLKQGIVATVGDDAFVKIWDLRRPDEPVYSRRDHSHWIWCVRFNQYHEQLLLTSSSDTKVLLTHLPVGSAGDGEKKEKLAEGPLQWYEQHEDSVYCVEWSRADPWTFASLSYDGRLVINRIPKQLKYQILL